MNTDIIASDTNWSRGIEAEGAVKLASNEEKNNTQKKKKGKYGKGYEKAREADSSEKV